MKIAKFIAILSLLIATPSWAFGHKKAAALPTPQAGMPEQWDPSIPLPKGATLTSSTAPKNGVVRSAEFSVAGNYDDIVNYYETEIPKAGFSMGPHVQVPARKVYNRSFSKGGMQDSVTVKPDAADPSKYIVHVAYTPVPGKLKHPHLARLRDWWRLWPHWWRNDNHIWQEGKDWVRRGRERAMARIHGHKAVSEPSAVATP